jgi:predicted regulator of Ras-like GTPase activity (Roadblock/LC7/MglB family)
VFRKVLQDAMRRTEGCLGALIMGTDGIVVEKVWQVGAVAETNLDVAAVEFASLVKNARRAGGEMALGRLREMTFTGEGGIFILRFVSEDYFVATILSPEGNFGRARYELRRAELLLENELAT